MQGIRIESKRELKSAVIRARQQRSSHTLQTSGLLRSIGVPVPNGKPGVGQVGRSIWLRPYWELVDMLICAEQCFKKRAKKIRTDLIQNHENAVRLIRTWRTIRERFAQHGIELAG